MSISRDHCRALLLCAAFTATGGSAADVPWDELEGDVARGNARAAELFCTVCHGPAGNSATPEWPTLAGQEAGYMAEQLRLFRTRQRTNAEMGPLAVPLTDADIVDLAAYFASEKRVATVVAGAPDPAGEKLYKEGDAARGIAACAICHGMQGEGNRALRGPALRGQQSVYVDKQLKDYAQKTRYTQAPDAASEAMAKLAAQLTPAEMIAIAGFAQRLLQGRRCT